jgi:hypothetical protein
MKAGAAEAHGTTSGVVETMHLFLTHHKRRSTEFSSIDEYIATIAMVGSRRVISRYLALPRPEPRATSACEFLRHSFVVPGSARERLGCEGCPIAVRAVKVSS